MSNFLNETITPENKITELSEQEIKARLSQNLLTLLKPSIIETDKKVEEIRKSQIELRNQIELLAKNLTDINENLAIPLNIDSYLKKLNNCKRRLTLINNILQNSQDRVTKLQSNISKESKRRIISEENQAITTN